MSCCPANPAGGAQASSYAHWVTETDAGLKHIDLHVAGVHCAGCISKIEGALGGMPGVERARVNLSTKRLALDWDNSTTSVEKVVSRLDDLGFSHQPFEAAATGETEDDRRGRELLRALAVAGFAAGNVMLLSVSVWSGAEAATRDLFHWLSALIALPATAYAGRPFFRSAAQALSHRRLNMDVPISLAVILAAGMSLHETIVSGAHAYFDACVMLLFFLLAGRYLDHMMRARARSAVTQLLKLTPATARVPAENGDHTFYRIADLSPGMLVLVPPGERVPVDGRVVEGRSDLDRSIVTGELVPEQIKIGDQVEAGTLNLTGELKVKVTQAGAGTFLSQMIEMMEAAEQGKARYVRIADRAAAVYAPLVHLAAALTFAGWLWISGDWHLSLITAIAVLIITCPCALGLAVPAVQMVACGRLFRRGIMVKDGSALERLAEVDTVVFDKTGTLTTGVPELDEATDLGAHERKLILSLAEHSAHPLSRALVAHMPSIRPVPLEDVKEVPGSGLEAKWRGQTIKLGSYEWCHGTDPGEASDLPSIYAAIDGHSIGVFRFRDKLRPDAAKAIADVKARGLKTLLLSGDRAPVVAVAAQRAGIEEWQALAKPDDKAKIIADLQAGGRVVLMVGDGINDAPALGTAHASMAPSDASDVGRMSAGLVFTGTGLSSVPEALDVAVRARRFIRQNFAVAALYNLIAVPVAVLGFASPLVAAIAMSASSLIVTGNALRLGIVRKPREKTAGTQTVLEPRIAT